MTIQCWLALHYILHGACNRWWTRPHGSSSCHQRSAITSPRSSSYANFTGWKLHGALDFKLTDLVYKNFYGLVPSYRADELIMQHSQRVSTASAFGFVSRTVCSSHPTLNLPWPSISSRRCTDLEQSSAAHHVCSVTSRLLLWLEDILLRTLLPVITVVVPAKWHCVIYGHVNRSYLTYLFCL